jgi:hypothetical protein
MGFLNPRAFQLREMAKIALWNFAPLLRHLLEVVSENFRTFLRQATATGEGLPVSTVGECMQGRLPHTFLRGSGRLTWNPG